MSRLILLDSGPLGLVSNPSTKAVSQRAKDWAIRLRDAGARLIAPEIADYEVRRELLRAGRVDGVARLDVLIGALEYLPISTAAMRMAARLWAEARNAGAPSAVDAALDGDVILAAQAILLGNDGIEVVVATTNPKHLERYVSARLWHEVA